MGAIADFGMTHQNIRANDRMQNRDMRFQRQMRSTSYQAMVNDLRKAGLNPMLAYQKQGMGGSSAGTGNPAAQSSGFDPSKIFAAQAMNAQAKKYKADARLTNAQADLAEIPAAVGKGANIKEHAENAGKAAGSLYESFRDNFSTAAGDIADQAKQGYKQGNQKLKSIRDDFDEWFEKEKRQNKESRQQKGYK